MVILGVDPGSRVTGFGVISSQRNGCRCLEYGAISSKKEQSFPERLRKIHGELQDLIKRHLPSVVVVEDLFHALNVQSALKLGHTRGVVLLAAAQASVSLFEYSPTQVKKAVVGYGRADKQQIQLMVRTLLNLKENPQPHDAADALAVALCHTFRNGRISGRLAKEHLVTRH